MKITALLLTVCVSLTLSTFTEDAQARRGEVFFGNKKGEEAKSPDDNIKTISEQQLQILASIQAQQNLNAQQQAEMIKELQNMTQTLSEKLIHLSRQLSVIAKHTQPVSDLNQVAPQAGGFQPKGVQSFVKTSDGIILQVD